MKKRVMINTIEEYCLRMIRHTAHLNSVSNDDFDNKSYCILSKICDCMDYVYKYRRHPSYVSKQLCEQKLYEIEQYYLRYYDVDVKH